MFFKHWLIVIARWAKYIYTYNFFSVFLNVCIQMFVLIFVHLHTVYVYRYIIFRFSILLNIYQFKLCLITAVTISMLLTKLATYCCYYVILNKNVFGLYLDENPNWMSVCVWERERDREKKWDQYPISKMNRRTRMNPFQL